MSKLELFVVSIVIAACGYSIAADQAPDHHPQPPDLPGVNSADRSPEGCVSCHIKMSDDQDYRIGVQLEDYAAHPKLGTTFTEVPGDCTGCHDSDKKGGALGPRIHKEHYDNPDTNHFVSMFQGSCLHCHTLDAGSGEMQVKAGQKNW